MGILGQLLRRTPARGWLSSYKARRSLSDWTGHDQAMLEFYRQFIPPGGLCFDVGANLGNRVKVFRKLGAKVIAVEPQTECARVLRSFYRHDPNVEVAETALGEGEGTAEMLISNAPTLSSMSREFIDAVQASGRFAAGYHWETKQLVPVTTLDRLIDKWGAPAFIKIDVEGSEYQVLKGLTRPVHALSIEFVPERLSPTFQAFEHLNRLGPIQLNYCLGENLSFCSPRWLGVEEMAGTLSRVDPASFGDVYIRFTEAGGHS